MDQVSVALRVMGLGECVVTLHGYCVCGRIACGQICLLLCYMAAGPLDARGEEQCV